MAKLADLASKVRSKNAGPFWLTIDIFCPDQDTFRDIANRLRTEHIENCLALRSEDIKRFEIADLNVIKISVPRPQIQGSRLDRDMHGATFACLIEELEI